MPRSAPFDPSCPQRALLNALTEFSSVNGCCFYGAICYWVPPCHTLSTACMPHCPPRFLLMSPLDNTQSSVITPRLPEPLHFSAFQRKMSFLFAAHAIPHWAPHWVQWCCPRNKTKWQAQGAQNHSSLPQADAVLQGFLAYIFCSFLKASLS